MTTQLITTVPETYAQVLSKNCKVTPIIHKSVEKPEKAVEFDIWVMIDCDGNTIAIKQLLDLALVAAIKGVAPILLKKKVWVTIKANSEYAKHIPKLDPNYTPAIQHLNKMVDLANRVNGKGNGRGYYGYGEAGCGKTSLCLFFCALVGQALTQCNCTESMEVDDLFLRQMAYEGKWTTCEGALLTAVRCGLWCLIDELDLAPASLPPSLNDLIEGHSFAVSGLKTSIRANDNFRLIACGNTGIACNEQGVYNGRNVIDESTLSRFVVDKYDNLTNTMIKNMVLKNFSEVSEEFATATSNFFEAVSKTYIAENITGVVSPRNILGFVEAYISNTGVVIDPLLYAISSSLPMSNEDETLKNSILAQASICFKEVIPTDDLVAKWEVRYDLA